MAFSGSFALLCGLFRYYFEFAIHQFINYVIKALLKHILFVQFTKSAFKILPFAINFHTQFFFD
ncbi:MAG: hypothetical protein EAY68_07260 [Bacteroidetes bacterium]|nr:MAG: hypothetical protein EAY68_07260 [Bacteroidota bacterium]